MNDQLTGRDAKVSRSMLPGMAKPISEPGEMESAKTAMKTHNTECTISTKSTPEFVDVTEEVKRALAGSHVSSGHVTVSVPAGCAIVVNENESGLISDLTRVIREMKESANGSEPRIASTSVVLPASGGRLRLGRWQRLLLVELREPTDRRVNIQVVGD